MKKWIKRRLSLLERKSKNSGKGIGIFVISTLTAADEKDALPTSVWIIQTGRGMDLEDYPDRPAFYSAVRAEMERIHVNLGYIT